MKPNEKGSVAMSAKDYARCGGVPRWTRGDIAKTRKWLEKKRKEETQSKAETTKPRG